MEEPALLCAVPDKTGGHADGGVTSGRSSTGPPSAARASHGLAGRMIVGPRGEKAEQGSAAAAAAAAGDAWRRGRVPSTVPWHWWGDASMRQRASLPAPTPLEDAEAPGTAGLPTWAAAVDPSGATHALRASRQKSSEFQAPGGNGDGPSVGRVVPPRMATDRGGPVGQQRGRDWLAGAAFALVVAAASSALAASLPRPSAPGPASSSPAWSTSPSSSSSSMSSSLSMPGLHSRE